ncbi:thioredoxin-like protein [Gigaspora rosea]|uniref:Thioredoxin-like protein n=1 Tax=Gigaspora rosea TaxID=44941 RepID=A0A397UW01_9GLOM|nr:thioredoxin-like protein [Gigaspora rosea]CAG8643144.1 10117_t:CDS:2 [Gigaspora rosea]
MTEEKIHVQIYGSSVPGNIFVKQNQMSIESILNANKIPFTFIDVAADETHLKYMKRKNGGKKDMPQIFVDGEFKGTTKELEEAVEMREVKEFLGLAK